jgi:hypothetical protein
MVIIVAVVFILTYNPESGNLNQVLCCNDDEYRAKNPDQCKQSHFRGVQFADSKYECPKNPGVSVGGAIIGK